MTEGGGKCRRAR